MLNRFKDTLVVECKVGWGQRMRILNMLQEVGRKLSAERAGCL